MIVRDYTGHKNIDNDEKGEFQYELIDVIVEGYTGQDNLQVTSILPHALRHVESIHSDVDFVYEQSDKTSFFSSQEHIAFIHHQKKELVIKVRK
jgi:hypothetical protein